MDEFENLKVGDEIPPLVIGPVTRQMLVEWCAAENDYYNLHYDERVAEAMKLPGTPIQGTYKYAQMGRMIEKWLRGRGVLRRISASYRGLNLEGETVTARGKVMALHATDGGKTIALEVWVENVQGERSTQGLAAVFVPD